MDTKREHKKKSFWQIWFPIGISIILVLLLAVFMVIWSTRDASGAFNTKWASISLVYLSLPAIIAAIIMLILLAGAIYLIAKLINVVPVYSEQIQGYLKQIRDFLLLASDKITAPIILVSSKYSGFTVLFRKKSK